MRGHLVYSLAFTSGLAHHPDLAHGQVPQPAVNQLGRARRRAGGEVVLLNQRHPQTAMGCVAGHARTGYSPSDDQEVEPLAPQPGQQAGSRGR